MGLLYLLRGRVTFITAQIQISWIHDPDTLLIRYEDLLLDEQTFFEYILNYCQIPFNRQRLRDIVQANSFETMTGRHRRQEDITVHQRKGMPGDWRNYFSERVKEMFKKRFGHILIHTGYERDGNW